MTDPFLGLDDEAEPVVPARPPRAAPVEPAGVSRAAPDITSTRAPRYDGSPLPPSPFSAAREADRAEQDDQDPGPVREFRAAPALPAWAGADTDPSYDYDPADDLSFTDLASVNREILRLRRLQARIGQAMAALGREVTEAEIAYDRAYRRALLVQKGRNAEGRKAGAELECEALEGLVAVRKRTLENLTVRFRAVRDDQQVLVNLSSNIRAVMAVR